MQKWSTGEQDTSTAHIPSKDESRHASEVNRVKTT